MTSIMFETTTGRLGRSGVIYAPAGKTGERDAQARRNVHTEPDYVPALVTADANTAELLLASVDVAGRRAGTGRNPWLAMTLVLAGVLAVIALAFLATTAVQGLFGF
jgi:hypothetical protein